VFKEFVQLNNPEGNRLKGLGLGLSIVQRSAVLLGHRLELKSVPGRGSCFSLEVPVADPVASPIESFRGRAGAEDHDFSGLTALVVEDDELARWALAALLRSWRCVVVEAATAEEAEQVLASGCRPNLIACDFRLPNHRNGVDLIQGVRATLGSEVAAFVLSGDTSEDVIKAVRSAGLPLLHKPVKAARLRRALQLLAVVRSAPRDSRDPARG
jgi:CheY-like chemotaxis protein